MLAAFILAGCGPAVSRSVRGSLHDSAGSDAERAVVDNWTDDFGRGVHGGGFRTEGNAAGPRRK